MATISRAKAEAVDPARLETVKSHLRYSFAMRMDHSEGIAGLLARYIGLARTPETINRLYDQYAAVTSDDLWRVANQCFVDANLVTATLRGAL